MEVSHDLRTGRLLKVLQAAALAEEIPKDSARRLVGLARSVRLLVESSEYPLAKVALMDIRRVILGAPDPWVMAVHKHCEEVQKVLDRR